MLKTVIVSILICLTEFSVIVCASPIGKPSLILRFLPDDIREAAKNHEEPEKWKQLVAHILLGLFLFSFIGGFVYLGLDGIHCGYGFRELWLRFVAYLYIIKAFDILVQDQWLVMTSGYYKKIFPETKDCAGWKNRGWNNRKQIVMIIIHPFLAAILAGLMLLIR